MLLERVTQHALATHAHVCDVQSQFGRIVRPLDGHIDQPEPTAFVVARERQQFPPRAGDGLLKPVGVTHLTGGHSERSSQLPANIRRLRFRLDAKAKELSTKGNESDPSERDSQEPELAIKHAGTTDLGQAAETDEAEDSSNDRSQT